jgi:ApaG protein
MFEARTRDIHVSVETRFLENESEPDNQYFVWAYHIRITNLGEETVQLLSRHWIITDGMGRAQEVKGEGVVGEQPILSPDGSYAYTSGTPLSTPTGMMRGTYLMETRSGERFEIEIPLFSLDSDYAKKILH